MPAPQKGSLEPLIQGMLQAANLTGENQADLAAAIAETLAGALGLLLQQAQVAPGIACSPAASTAPGRLL